MTAIKGFTPQRHQRTIWGQNRNLFSVSCMPLQSEVLSAFVNLVSFLPNHMSFEITHWLSLLTFILHINCDVSYDIVCVKYLAQPFCSYILGIITYLSSLLPILYVLYTYKLNNYCIPTHAMVV